MTLTGLTYLVTAICCCLGGLALIYTRLHALFGTGPDVGDYLFIVLMAMSVFCFWFSVKFIIINRHVRAALPLLIVLVPMIFASLYVISHYVSYVVGIYEMVH